MKTAADVIVISSSPDRIPTDSPTLPAHDSEKVFNCSRQGSSPSPVRSPSELFRPPTRSRFFDVEARTDEPLRNKELKTSKEAPIRKITSSKSKDTSSEDKPKRRGRKPASESQTILGDGGPASLTHENTSKKTTASRKKRVDNEGKRGKTTNKIITGRIAKSGNAQAKPFDEKAGDMPTAKVSSQKNSVNEVTELENDGLQLESAMKRRLDWTPTKDTTLQTVELDREGAAQDNPTKFSSLLFDYGFNDVSSTRSDVRSIGDDGPTKRRRIELVDSRLFTASKQASYDIDEKTCTDDDQQAQSELKSKPKRQTKKFTTLTARVTARYLNDLTETSDSSSKETGSLRENVAPGRAKGSKSKGKGISKPQEPEFIVLSPEAAAKSLEDQDLIFGTCSQLVREDSPTTLRELQEAITESEISAVAELSPLSSTLCATPTSRFSTARGLWSVAARDPEGSLIRQAEVIDLVNTPQPAKIPMTNDRCAEQRLKETADIVNNKPSGLPRDEAPRLKDKLGAKRESTPVPDKTTTIAGSDTKETTRSTEPQPAMPHYSGFTDAELSKQISAYGFKSIKSRKAMIELLQRCWESRHGKRTTTDTQVEQRNASTDPTLEIAPSESKESKKPPRKTTTSRKPTARSKTKPDSNAPTKSRTRKPPSTASTGDSSKAPSTQTKPSRAPSTHSFINVEEIEDSEEETVPSPNRVQNRYSPQPPETRQRLPVSRTPLSPSRHATTQSRANLPASTTLTSLNQKPPDLADQITKAIHAQPAGTPSRPSWYEKILLYDPIILEDFATWLNTEGLGLIGEDREVGAGFLRTWCESRGICCCYR
ncbi:structure-specific endonuclease subunit slx4 [Aspergillus coremiiformis]|uniref:Structure-specific endonuclease subunit SLX4 n=1 Tax=Aspergillus coremiiformis TaxID=138285 RepID=A0A5N6YXX3_9EURO|nr:structure-specific endonuclease subunit slx4 [Aspergillus coremiiformis]